MSSPVIFPRSPPTRLEPSAETRRLAGTGKPFSACARACARRKMRNPSSLGSAAPPRRQRQRPVATDPPCRRRWSVASATPYGSSLWSARSRTPEREVSVNEGSSPSTITSKRIHARLSIEDYAVNCCKIRR
ncbi:hypothetical protein HPP92_018959 [Vanilla planifolia]|uniref:Uncharacterized protein n=1 Tax=Vanilla planifolia TaxID=51239 RepID=A0A835UHM5_VANPL|nr:hypothetical protein HPP92_019518 [Vanilla planifolia]KAG0464795.1 hypothetical protein HPP92_018959 [Vanilla planifolia]